VSKRHFKRPQPTSEQSSQTESFLTIGYDVPWDRERSPLWALAHYADPDRRGRLVMVDADPNDDWRKGRRRHLRTARYGVYAGNATRRAWLVRYRSPLRSSKSL
jgi:hypothetical protein